MSNEVVLSEDIEPGIRMLTLNRPERLNAINTDFIETLHQRLDEVAADSSVRVVVLTGAGRGFCAGADLVGGWDDAPTAGKAPPSDVSYWGQRRLSSLVARMRAMPTIFVAAVNGAAAGGGFALTLASDVRLASTTAKFLVANVKIGISAGEMGISYLLPRVIGGGRATELMLTGRTIGADEALEMGLVSKVVEPDQVVTAALDHARLICSNPTFGVALSKEMIAVGLDSPSLAYALLIEDRTQVLAGYSGDIAQKMEEFRSRGR